MVKDTPPSLEASVDTVAVLTLEALAEVLKIAAVRLRAKSNSTTSVVAAADIRPSGTPLEIPEELDTTDSIQEYNSGYTEDMALGASMFGSPPLAWRPVKEGE